MDETTRQKRIEAGKQMLERFKKKKKKKKCSSSEEVLSSDSPSVTSVSPLNSVCGSNDQDAMDQQGTDECASNSTLPNDMLLDTDSVPVEEGQTNEVPADEGDLNHMALQDIGDLLADLQMDQVETEGCHILEGKNVDDLSVDNVSLLLPYVQKIEELEENKKKLQQVIYQLCAKLESAFREESSGGTAEVEQLVSVVEDMSQQIQKVSNSLLCSKDSERIDESAQTSFSSGAENVYHCPSCQSDTDVALHAFLRMCVQDREVTGQKAWDVSKLENFLLHFDQEQDTSSPSRTFFLHLRSVLKERNLLRDRLKELEEQSAKLSTDVEVPLSVCNTGTSTSDAGSEDATHSSFDHALKRLLCVNVIAKMLETFLTASRKNATGSFNLSHISAFATHLHMGQNQYEADECVPLDGSCLQEQQDSHFPDEQNNSEVSLSSFAHSVNLSGQNNHGSSSSIEIFRCRDVSRSLTNLKEFLQEEASSCCSQLDASFSKSGLPLQLTGHESTDFLMKVDERELSYADVSLPTDLMDFKNSSDLRIMYGIYAQEKANLEQSLERLTEWEKSEPKCVADSEASSTETFNLLHENIPSCVSLVSFTDTENKTEATEVCRDTVTEIDINQDVAKEQFSSIKEEISDENTVHYHCKEYVEDLKSHHKEELAEVKAGFGDLTAELQKKIDELEAHIVELTASKENLNQVYDKTLLSLQEKESNWSEEKSELLFKIQSLEGELKSSRDSIEIFLKENSEFEKQFAELEVKFESDLNGMKQSLEEQYVNENSKLSKQVEYLECCKEELDSLLKQSEIRHLQELSDVRKEFEAEVERCKNLAVKIKNLEEELKLAEEKIVKCTDEKVSAECYWQNQVADLVQEYEQEMESFKKSLHGNFDEKEKRLLQEKASEIEALKKSNEEQIQTVKAEMQCTFEDEKQKLKQCWNDTVNALEAQHSTELSSYQKKVESLLEEKCTLITKSKEELEKIIRKNHRALQDLCDHIQSKIAEEVGKLETDQSVEPSLDGSVVETFSSLSKKVKESVDAFFKQSCIPNEEAYPILSREELDRLTVSLENENSSAKATLKDMQEKIQSMKEKHAAEIEFLKEKYEKELEMSRLTLEDGSITEHVQEMFRNELEKVKEEFVKEIMMHKDENERLAVKLQIVTNNLSLLEECNLKLKAELQAEKLKKEGEENAEVDGSVSHAAQTNSRLLHVLSDLVKTFVDIERDINTRLMEYGLIGSHSEVLTLHDDDTGQSIGSREDCANLSAADGPNLELTEDGPDLTPRAWDLFASVGTYDAEIEGEDVVIGASRRLRAAVDQVLNLLALVFDKQKDHDFKLLIKRNEELSHELQEESEDKENLHIGLLNAESMLRKFEAEKKKLEDDVSHLNEEKDLLSYEISSLKSKIVRLEDEKDASHEENKQLREHCSLLASRLGDPEKKLLQENTKLSSEKLLIQKRLNKERQNLSSRVQQLELSIEEITAEKEDTIEKLRNEIEELKSQIEAMDKQLQSNKKFIDEQVVEREQEREEYYKELRKLREMLKEKEKAQNIEEQLAKEAESLEQQLKAKIDEHKSVIARKDELERELRQALDKIHDLREIIVELEKQLELKARTETELKQKLGAVSRSLSVHEQNNEDLKNQLEECSLKEVFDDSVEKMRELEEQLVSKTQEVEQLSQSENMLQELRGQIHFLEAKVDQKVKLLEATNLVSLSSPVLSDETSHSDSHDFSDQQLQYIACSDGWEMSPRSVHWLEIRRLEEKVVRLMHMEEELIKQNKELTSQLRKLKLAEDEHCQEKETLQQQVTSQLLQISALKADLDEHRHRAVPHVNIQHMMEELERARNALDLEKESGKHTADELAYLQEELQKSRRDVEAKEETIIRLQNELSAYCERKRMTCQASQTEQQEVKNSNNMALLEKMNEIQEILCKRSDLVCPPEVGEVKKLIEIVLLEKQDLAHQLKLSEEHVAQLQSLLKSSQRDLENERIQVEMLIGELHQLSAKEGKDESIEDTPGSATESEKRVQALLREKALLTLQLQKEQSKLQEAEEERNLFVARIKDLQEALNKEENRGIVYQDACTGTQGLLQSGHSEDEVKKLKQENKELSITLDHTRSELAKCQAEILVHLARIHELEERSDEAQAKLEHEQAQLESDFNTVQDMMQRKEAELCSLQEETENQLRLEAEVDSLHKCLEQQRSVEQQLYNKISNLEKAVEDEKSAHSASIREWEHKVEDLCQVVADLKKQISVLKSDLFLSEDFDDVDLEDVEEKITRAAEGLKECGGDNTLFRQIVYRILKQVVDLRVSCVQRSHDAHIEKVHKSWQEKLEEERNNLRAVYQGEFEKEMVNVKKKHRDEIKFVASKLRKKYEENMSDLRKNNDQYWHKINEIEAKLKQQEKGVEHHTGEMARKVEEVEQELVEFHERELNNLREKIQKLLKEKEAECEKLSQALKEKENMHSAHEIEKAMILKECENKLEEVARELKNEFAKQDELEKLSQLLKEKENLQSVHEREKAILLKECEDKLEELADKLSSEFAKQKQEMEEHYQAKIKELQEESARLVEEQHKLEVKQKHEVENMQHIFTEHWDKKMQKFQKLYEEEIDKIKQSKERNVEEALKHVFTLYESKLKEMQDICESQISSTKTDDLARHQAEMHKLKKHLEDKFNREKQEALETKEKQLRERYEQKLSEKLKAFEQEICSQRAQALEESLIRRLGEEKENLLAAHRNEVELLRKEYQDQLLEKEAELLVYRDEVQKLEEKYHLELGNAKEMIEALKLASSKLVGSYSKSAKTSSSDINSTDDNCSSCIGDLSPTNLSKLLVKLRTESAEVAALSEKQMAKLLEERQSVLDMLEGVVQVSDDSDLRSVIRQLVEELRIARKEVEDFLSQSGNYKQQITRLQRKLDLQTAEFAARLEQHKRNYAELEAVSISQRKEISRLNHALRSAIRESVQKMDSAAGSYVQHEGQGDSSGQTPSHIELPRSELHPQSKFFSASSPHIPSFTPPPLADDDSKTSAKQVPKVSDNAEQTSRRDATAENNSSVDSIIKEISLRYHSMQSLGSPDWLQWKSTSVSDLKVPYPMYNSPVQEHGAENTGLDRTCKTSLVRVTCSSSKQDGSGENRSTESNAWKLQHLYWKYRRSCSYRKALIFQKNYLLQLLSGFQATEEITLAMLSKMGVTVSKCLNASWASSATDESPKGRSLFRSAVFVIVALHRMQYLVIRWKKAAVATTSAQFIQKELNIMDRNMDCAPKAGNSGTGCEKTKSASGECSSTSSVSSEELPDGHRTSRLRSSHQTDNIEENERGPLFTYVRRLRDLHEQLGLSDPDRS